MTAVVALSTKKIKKFRVETRLAPVLRALRGLNVQTTPELEKDVEAEAKAAQNFLSTAALYQTHAAGSAPAWAAQAWQAAVEEGGKREPVALTFFAATVGPALEAEVAAALSRGEELRAQILSAVGQDLAEQSARFVSRLVAEEAKNDSCELSEPREAPDAAALLDSLEASRIGLTTDGAGQPAPRFTRLGYIVWWPPAKKRK